MAVDVTLRITSFCASPHKSVTERLWCSRPSAVCEQIAYLVCQDRYWTLMDLDVLFAMPLGGFVLLAIVVLCGIETELIGVVESGNCGAGD